MFSITSNYDYYSFLVMKELSMERSLTPLKRWMSLDITFAVFIVERHTRPSKEEIGKHKL